MQKKLTYKWSLPPASIRFFIIALLLLGVFFRLVNLDQKVYWLDETFTSLRVSGYTEQELVQQVSQQITSIKDLQKYQHLAPEKSVIDTIRGLALEEAQLPPLYFIMSRFWVQIWGDSVAAIRSLPALINLLAFPCIYWLCLELFESSLTGWIAIALFAVSPFQVLYAQEARPYSLWAVTILLSSASLLRAMRLNTRRSWSMYALTVAVGLYSYLYFVLIAIGHGIYVLGTESLRISKRVIAFLLASLVALFAFSSWIVVLVTNWTNVSNKSGWENPELPETLADLVKLWVSNFRAVFIDFGFLDELPSILAFTLRASALILLILVVYATYFVCRHTPKRVWLFILTLTFTTALALMLPDLVSGGIRSTMTRYLVPTYLGIQLAFAYLFATKITSKPFKIQKQKLWQSAMVILLSLGVISCVVSSQAEAWYNKGPNYNNLQIARMINSTSQPLLITDTKRDMIDFMDIGFLMSLSYVLEPKVQVELVVEPNSPKFPQGFSDVFLTLNPSKKLQYELEQQNYELQAIKFKNPKSTLLWKLVKS
jgi:uncharacterized membrane protein